MIRLKNRKIFNIYFMSVVFRLFQRNSDTRKIIKEKIFENDLNEYGKIRCPLCKWQPNKSSRWYCASSGAPEFYFSGCLTSWNTFDTRGKCPGCNHQWRWTTCLSCHRDSLHEDWYLKN